MNIEKLREWAFGQNTVTNTHNHSSSNVESSSSSSSSSLINNDMDNVINQNMMMTNANAASISSIHLDLVGGLLSHSEPTSQTSNVAATNSDEFGDGSNNRKKKKKNKKNVDDGKLRSLPYKKYGPYTCPTCKIVLTTSQKYANHVKWIHHKDGKKKT
ncbi:GATA zinc finger domain-containing protein 18-like [Trifolium pratense]|uniref:GATA zinc finger domain-containing protein 18-like n=1 Tax=Trifolium pratense TaxID=57577 RepID=UPI001E69606D|nr:GATA zinc finger domain-containing protein 18-like [Trifolium pratense]